MTIRSLCIALAIATICIPSILFSAPVVHATAFFDAPGLVYSASVAPEHFTPLSLIAFIKSPSMLAVLFIVTFFLVKLIASGREFESSASRFNRTHPLGGRIPFDWRRS